MKSAVDLVAAAKARITEVPGAIHASHGMLEFKLSGSPALAAHPPGCALQKG